MPAFNGLYAPYWRTDARGVLVGLSGNVGRAQIARATLEAVAHQSRQLLETMDAEAGSGGGGGGGRGRSLKVDGGMTANSLLMQFQSCITGRRVVRPVVAETTALGAAYAAGLAVGFWKDTEELAQQWKQSATWEPKMAREAVASTCLDWERAVARSLNWHHHHHHHHHHHSAAAAVEAKAADPALALLRAPLLPRQGSVLPTGLLRSRASRVALGVAGALGLALHCML